MRFHAFGFLSQEIMPGNNQQKKSPQAGNPERLLIEVLFCVVPAAAFIRFGALNWGVKAYFGSLLLLLFWHLLVADFKRYFGLIVSTIPMLMPLRKLFLFNVLLAISVVGLTGWLIVSPHVIARVKRNKLLCALIGLTLLYWWASFLWTGIYSSNLRILDLSLVACLICLLASDKPLLRVVMTGVAISVVLIAIALSPYSERLGIAVVGNLEIGNPIEMGEGAGLIFLLATAGNGAWLYTRKNKWIRASIWIASLVCLLLSTSRGGWLTVAGTLFVLCCSVRGERPKVLGAVAAMALVIAGLIASGHGSSVVKYFDKVASPERTLSQKTTLRADQWVTVVRILNASPVLGAGVGEGFAANVTYGSQALIFHSLYLQIAAETGLLGLLILAVYLFRLIAATRKHLGITGEAAPLLGCVGFMIIGLSVACFDPLSGIYLGLALLSGFRYPNDRLLRVSYGTSNLDREGVLVSALCPAE